MARRVTEAEKAKIRELRTQGMSYWAIAREVGRGATTISCVCDPACQATEMARRQTPEYKAAQKAYRESPKCKAAKKAYRESPEGKAYQKAYAQTPKRKAYTKAYEQTPKRKACMKAYKQSFEYKVTRKVYTESPKYKAAKKTYEQTPECKAAREAYRQTFEYKASQKAYHESPKCKAVRKAYQKAYRQTIQGRLRRNLRARLYRAINGNQKAGSAVRDLGCTIEQLKAHLEAQFRPGMTWDNWSFEGWHIDHIKPLASFDLTDRDQFLQACHYTNLQPLWAEENLIKRDKIPDEYRQYQLAIA